MSAIVEQGSQEWLQQRIGKFGGTAVGVLDGLNPYRSSADLMRGMVRELAGAESEFKMVPPVQHGMDMEPTAKAWYEKEFKATVSEHDFILHKRYDFLGASPDGLVKGDNGFIEGAIEIKCPFPRYNPKPYSIRDKKKGMYLSQVNMVMEVCDVEWIDFIVYCAKDYRSKPTVNVERIYRDEKWLHELMDGRLMPKPCSSRVPRIDLYFAWHEHLMKEFQDIELRAPHLAPITSDLETVHNEDFSALTQTMLALQKLETKLANELTQITNLTAEKNRLKAKIAAEFQTSVTDGTTKVLVTNRKGSTDFKSAFEKLGGEIELAKQDLTLLDFEREAGRQQVSVKFGE